MKESNLKETLKKSKEVLKLAPSKRVDNFAKKQLVKHAKNYISHVDTSIAEVRFKINQKEFESLLDALTKVETLSEFEIHFYHPKTDGAWEYDTPTRLIKINEQAIGGLMMFPVDPFLLNKWNPDMKPAIAEAMFRSYLPYYYSPETIKSHSKKVDDKFLVPPRALCTPNELWRDMREKGIVPFQLNICAYTKEIRYKYRINVLENTLLKDFRDNRIPIANRVVRSSLDSFNLDKILSTQELPIIPKRVLQIIFELNEAMVSDIEIGLGITEKMARNAIKSLMKRGFLIVLGKPPQQAYIINLDAVRKTTN
jgi:hypothetical protein